MRLHKRAMKPRLSVLAAACAVMAMPAVAEAQDQPWLRDRGYTEGIGVRVGDFEFHPGVAAEFGFDSNYFRRDSNEFGGPVGSLRLRLTPSISLATLGKQRREPAGGSPPDVEFRSALAFTYNEFFPVTGPAQYFGLMREQRNVGVNLDADLLILPGRPWSVDLYANFARILTASEQGITSDDFKRDVPRLGAEVIWTPGSGLLDWRLGYQFTGTLFENITQLTNFDHQIQTRGRWRFLPRTALMYDARFSFINYPNAVSGGKTASHPLRARIGINGLVTSSFALMALAGWGASFYEPVPPAEKAEDFNSLIGQVELKWFITPNPSNDPAAVGLALSTLSLGFTRDFSDDYLSTYTERDRGYAKFSYFFGGRFLAVVEGGAGAVIYPANTATDRPAGFTDVRIDASLLGEYRIKNAFGINGTLRYNQNVSGASAIIIDGSGGMNDPLRYQEFEVYLGARWLM
jgi:hypothetical protein